MSNPDELDRAFLDAVALDDERDLRAAGRLRPGEFDRAAKIIASWPNRDEYVGLTPNELRWVMLLALELDARPLKSERPLDGGAAED